MTREPRPIHILLVEDNPADVRLTREALKEGRILNDMTVASDGQEALDILFRRPPHEEAPYPDLILLDLNLPKVDGHEVLKNVKGNPDLAPIPVVILTTSEAEEDIIRTYELHANCFISKPVEMPRFIEVVKSIENFWMTVVTLPRQ